MITKNKHGVWEARSPAKLNLTLNILGKRSDGFHDIHSVMTRIDLYDSIFMSVTETVREISLTVDDRRKRHPSRQLDPVPTDERNLIIRALKELQNQSGCDSGMRVHLTKRIPSQAGLGGGSSNAATAMGMANRIWNLKIDRAELSEIAAKLGSDIPFFLGDSPAICEGLGEIATPLGGIPKINFVIVHPPFGLATADVYGRYSSSAPKRLSTPPLGTFRTHRLGALLCNDLQPAAEAIAPGITRLKQLFASFDLVGHQMSGSGSAYFGICRSASHARRVAGHLRNRNTGDVFVAQTVVAKGGSLRL